MHQFEHFFHFAAFWFRNDDECRLLPDQEPPRKSTWLPIFRKATRHIPVPAKIADKS